MPKIPKGYAQKHYDTNTKAEAKYLYIDKELSYVQISNHFGGRPTWQTVRNWAITKDPVTNLSWQDEKKKKYKDKYLKLSPQQQAQGLMDAVNHIIDVLSTKIKKGSTDVKELSTLADSLAKINKTLENVVDKKFQIPMMYEFLEKFVSFLQLNYKQFITPEFINVIKHFKNDLRKQLEMM
mgnify:CR=1 FL=1